MATELIPQCVSNESVDCSSSTMEATLVEEKENNENTSENGKGCKGEKKKEHHQNHRRKPSKKKRKWKPYNKMTWEEKKAVEEKEKERADRIRGEMLDRGRPVAPYNTTQFIMAEHDPYEEEPVGSTGNDGNTADEPVDEECMDDLIEAEYMDSPHMAPDFISQDFSEAYERVQEESLSSMTRDDLVKEHLSLERTLSFLQSKLAEEKNINNSYSVKVTNIEEELEKLRKDNERLVRENMELRYGDDAVAGVMESGVYQTSDYDYEIPLSDDDAGVKYSEDYNDAEEGRVEPSVAEGGVDGPSQDCDPPVYFNTMSPLRSSPYGSDDTDEVEEDPSKESERMIQNRKWRRRAAKPLRRVVQKEESSSVDVEVGSSILSRVDPELPEDSIGSVIGDLVTRSASPIPKSPESFASPDPSHHPNEVEGSHENQVLGLSKGQSPQQTAPESMEEGSLVSMQSLPSES